MGGSSGRAPVAGSGWNVFHLGIRPDRLVRLYLKNMRLFALNGENRRAAANREWKTRTRVEGKITKRSHRFLINITFLEKNEPSITMLSTIEAHPVKFCSAATAEAD